MSEQPTQAEVPFEFRQVKAVRTDEASVYDYEIENLADIARHYWVHVQFDLPGETDRIIEGTIEPGEKDVVTLECPNDNSATVWLEYTHSGKRVIGGGSLIGPLPTIGFEA